jgi:hypothetical protein
MSGVTNGLDVRNMIMTADIMGPALRQQPGPWTNPN